MSYGTLSIISDYQVFHEVAVDSALYFDQDKPSVMANHMESVLSSQELLDEYGKRAKKQADSFKWDVVASSVHDKIVQLLSER